MATEDDDTRERELRDIADEARTGDGMWSDDYRPSQRGHVDNGSTLKQFMRVIVHSNGKLFLAALLGGALAMSIISYYEASDKATTLQLSALSQTETHDFMVLSGNIAEVKTQAQIAKNHADNLKSDQVDPLAARITAIEQRGPQHIVIEEITHHAKQQQ